MISSEQLTETCEHVAVLNNIHELVCEKCGLVLEESEFRIMNVSDSDYNARNNTSPIVLHKSTKIFFNRTYKLNRRLYRLERRFDRFVFDKFFSMLCCRFDSNVTHLYSEYNHYLQSWEQKFVWVYELLHRECNLSVLQYKAICNEYNIKFKLELLYGKYAEQKPLQTQIREALQTFMDLYHIKIENTAKICHIIEVCYNSIKNKRHINNSEYCIYALLIKTIPVFKTFKTIAIKIGSEKFKPTSITNYFPLCALIDTKIKLAKDVFKSLIWI